MGKSGHRLIQSLTSYHRPSEEMKRATAAILDVETAQKESELEPITALAEIDQYIATVSVQELACLESSTPTHLQKPPQQTPQPINFAGASFTGCTLNFSLNPLTADRFRTIFTSGCILHVSLLKLALVTPRLRKNRCQGVLLLGKRKNDRGRHTKSLSFRLWKLVVLLCELPCT